MPSTARARRAPGILAAVALLAACSGGDGRKPSQVAAQVNGDEISVHQVNYQLQRTPGVPAERAPEVRREILERLIDQEVLVQKARETRLDRDAEVLQRLEAARREVLSRAYLERVAAQVPRPDAAAVKSFYASNPDLFTQRKVYRLNEIVLPGRPANWAQLAKELEPLKTAAEAADLLRRRGIDVAVATNVARGSESIPLEILPKFARLKVGDMAIFPNGQQIVIAEIRAMQDAPLDEKQAGPAIEQFVVNRRRTEAVQSEVKRLREAAKVAYVGEFNAGGSVSSDAPKPAAPAKATEKGAIEKGIGGLK
jgi:EpsD family peptidyl-prolyl cis-trans isomerase